MPPIDIPSNTWVDLYSETSISNGTKLIIQNVGGNDARLSESSSKPDIQFKSIGYNNISPGQYLESDSAPVGLWAYAYIGTSLQVEVS